MFFTKKNVSLLGNNLIAMSDFWHPTQRQPV